MSGSTPANSDVLMYFKEKKDGDALEAESTSTIDTGDSLVADFRPGRYFQAENFSFGIKLEDDGGGGGGGDRPFAKWRGLTDSKLKPDPPYMAEPDDVSITRMIDSSSPLLLRHCLNTDPFFTVVLVKRARVGTTGVLATILRMEFGTVWLKSIEWEDNDAVMETCKFKFNRVSVTYMKRRPDGTVVSPWPCSWTNQFRGASTRG